ncbi:MAG TPA: hypothetical protein VIJ85_01480 [Rhizomicrobium sp.]
MNNRIIAPLLAVAVALSGAAIGFCASAAPVSGFAYQSKVDVFGYYIPATDIRVGKFQLSSIDIGPAEDFKSFLGGKRLPEYAPVMASFDDKTSKQLQGELGPYYQNAPRVLPSAFNVTGSDVAFDGTEKQVGHVTFTGRLNLKALAGAKGNGDANAVVMTGDLTIGQKTFKAVSFRWFGGD